MNKTQQTLTTRVTALESDMAEVKAGVSAILAHLEVGQPAKARKAPARKAPARKAASKKVQPKADAPVKALCKPTRLAFIAAAKAQGLADFTGLGTSTIAAMCVEDPSLVPAGFRIGERNLARFS